MVAILGWRHLMLLELLLLAACAEAGVTWSSVDLYPCQVLIQGEPYSLCCRTENIPPGAIIRYYNSRSSKPFAKIRYPCDVGGPLVFQYLSCFWDGAALIYNLTLPKLEVPSDSSTWRCGFYGNSSTFVLDTSTVFTSDLGFKLARKDHSTVLSWQVNMADIAADGEIDVYTPAQGLLLNASKTAVQYVAPGFSFVGNLTTGNMSLLLKNVDRARNGTYACSYVSLFNRVKQRISLTLVVLENPRRPIIANDTQSVAMESNMASGTIFCNTSSRSAAPLYYYPDFNYTWLVPSANDSQYTTVINGSQLHITGIDCSKTTSLPVFCYASEGDEVSSDSEAFYPHTLCNGVVPPAHGSDKEKGAQVGLAWATAVLAIILVFMTVIPLVVGRRVVCRKLKRCSRKHCCRRCQADSDSDSDSDAILESSRRRRDMFGSGRNTENPGLHDGLGVRDSGLQEVMDQIAIEESRARGNQEGSQSPPPPPFDSGDEGLVGATAGPSADQPPPTDERKLLDEVEQLLIEFNGSLSREAVTLDFHRDSVLDNMICHYTDPVLTKSRVVVKVTGEEGMDCGGVMEDIYTSFWYRAQEHFFIGCEAVVPYLPPHKLAEEEKFKVLGRILSHSVALLKAIPVPICKSSLIVMIYGDTRVAKETLLEDFLYFLDPHDRSLVQTALTNFQSLTMEQKDELRTIFERYDYGAVIKEDTFSNDLLHLARIQICIKPKPLLDLMRDGIHYHHLSIFWERLHLDFLDVLYKALKPTAARIVSRLKIVPDETMNSQKQRAFEYLQRLLKDLTDLEIETFLQFVTGQKCTPRQLITISFTHKRGFNRVPVAHTCSNHLELPATYDSYDTFRSEFKHLLAADEAMMMTMA